MPRNSKMAAKLLVLLSFVFAAIVQNTDGACTFPSGLTGTWTSSRWGDITFTTTQLTVTLSDIGTVVLECELKSGTLHVLRSTTSVTVLTNVVDVVTCLDLQKQSNSKFVYYHGSKEIVFLSGNSEPVELVSQLSTITVSDSCNITSPYHVGTNHMLIKTGSEGDIGSQCPNPFLGTFDNYTIDMGSGPQCGGVGYFTVCDNRMNVTVDYSICADTMFYSSGGSLQCLYYSTNGSTYYVNLYNFDATVDDSTTFRFTCLAIEYGSGSDDYVYATQYPNSCPAGQTGTTVPSTPLQGGTILMHPNVASTSSSSGSSIGIIIAVIIILLIIILVALAIYHLWYRKRWPMVKEKLPCLRGKSKRQVDPQMENGDNVAKPSPAQSATSERPPSGRQTLPPVVPTAVVTSEEMRRLQSSQSSRSVATPSKLQTDLMEGEKGAVASLTSSAPTDPSANPTPRRLPPLETSHAPAAGESQGQGQGPSRGPYSTAVPLEPVYLAQQRVAPLVEATRLSEESESSDAVSIPPRLPPIWEREPVYQNM